MKRAYVDVLKHGQFDNQLKTVVNTFYGYQYNENWTIYKDYDHRTPEYDRNQFCIVHTRTKFVYAKFNTLNDCITFLSRIDDTWFNETIVDTSYPIATLIWPNNENRAKAKQAYMERMSLIEIN